MFMFVAMFLSFSLCIVIPQVNVLQFIYHSSDGHLVFSPQFGHIMSNAAMNILVHVLCTCARISLDVYIEVKVLDHRVYNFTRKFLFSVN